MNNANIEPITILPEYRRFVSENFIWFFITLSLIIFTFAGGALIADFPLTTLVRLIGLVVFSTLVGTLISKRLAYNSDRCFAGHLFLTAFAVRLVTGVLMGLYLLKTNGVPLFQDDTKTFQGQAVELFNGNFQWNIEERFGVSGPSLIYSLIYRLLGDTNPFLSLVPNILLSALTPVLVWRIAQELKISEQIARNSAWLVTFLPVTVIYSSTHLKEGTIALATTLVLYLIITKFYRPYYLTILMALPFILIIFLYRDRLGFPLLFLFLVGMGITNKSKKFSPILLVIWLIIGSVLMVLILDLGLWLGKQNVLDRVFFGNWWVLEKQPRSLLSPIAFLSKANPLIILLFSPINMLYLLLLPLPWFVLNEDMYFEISLLSIANIVWIFLIPLFFVGCVALWKRAEKIQKLPVLLSLGGLLAMAFAIDELGMMGRHKEIFIPFILIVVAEGLQIFRSWHLSGKSCLISITMLGFSLISALYLLSKKFILIQSFGIMCLFMLVCCVFAIYRYVINNRYTMTSILRK